MPLLGRELSKLNAKITFEKGQIQVHKPEEKALGHKCLCYRIKRTQRGRETHKIEDGVTPLTQMTGIPARSQEAKLVTIQLKPGTRWVK